MATVHCPGEIGFTFYPSNPPDCSNNKKMFDKCNKVFPTSFCYTFANLKQCSSENIDCILRKQEFEECLKNGCPPDTCDKRTQYLTLCVKDKSQVS